MTSGQMIAFAIIFIFVGTFTCVFTFISLYLVLEKAHERGVVIETRGGEL
jgi:hypothetical protein